MAAVVTLCMEVPAFAAPEPVPATVGTGGWLSWLWPTAAPEPAGISQPSEGTPFLRPVVTRQDVDGVPVVTMEFAQIDPVYGNSSTTPTVQSRGFIGQIIDSIGYGFSFIYNTITSGLTPPSPNSFAKKMKSKDPYDFWQLIGDAGYKLKSIYTNIGVVPDVEFHFKYVRELSNGDINWLERKLSKHAAKFSDPVSFIQRTIIYSLLEITSSDSYFVEELKVDLLPLPRAVFVLSPWEAGLSREHDELLRAIQGKTRVQRKPTEGESHY